MHQLIHLDLLSLLIRKETKVLDSWINILLNPEKKKKTDLSEYFHSSASFYLHNTSPQAISVTSSSFLAWFCVQTANFFQARVWCKCHNKRKKEDEGEKISSRSHSLSSLSVSLGFFQSDGKKVFFFFFFFFVYTDYHHLWMKISWTTLRWRLDKTQRESNARRRRKIW